MPETTDKLPLRTDALVVPDPAAAQRVTIDLPEFEWAEIVKHRKRRDLWIVIHDKVYNVGEFMFHHPGGADVYFEVHGKDATQDFTSVNHPPYVTALMESFVIGRVKPGSKPPAIVAPQAGQTNGAALASAAAADSDGLKEIPVAIPELKLDGERFLNFDILNDGLSQIDYLKQFGHIYSAQFPNNGGRIVVVSDPDLLDEVAGNAEMFGKIVEGINFFTQLQKARGSGISVVSDTPYYQKVRRLMMPWYSPAHQKTQLPRMKDMAAHFMRAWSKIPNDKPLDMREWAARYALEISGRGACSFDFKVLDPEAKKSDFAKAIPECLKEALNRVVEPAPDKFGWFGDAEKKKKSKDFYGMSETLFKNADRIVQTRLETTPLGEQTDLLTRLITEKDPETGERLGPEVVRDQILMHLSNGFNGPSITLTWITYLLTLHADVERKVLDEIDAITGGDPDYDLKYEDLMSMKYITQVIKEALRVYPPMPTTVRNCLRDGALGPWRVKKGDLIFVATLAAHRNPEQWGKNPDKFDPENFTIEKVLARKRHAFIPFSVGERQCMAQEVSFMMLRVAIFYIWNRYRLRLAPGAKVTPRAVVTMGPIGVQLTREPREPKEERQARIAQLRDSAKSSGAYVENSNSTAWDVPSEIPETSAFKNVLVAHGSNFGTCKDLAARLTSKSKQLGFAAEVHPLNGLIEKFEQGKPNLLLIVTSTYTGNPPSNANKFKAWLQQQKPDECWRNTKFVLWGLGNSQWNAYLAFPRYLYQRLQELGATPLHEMGIGDVGSPVWEENFVKWNNEVWPRLIDLSGAKPSAAAAAAAEAARAEGEKLKTLESGDAMQASLWGEIVAPKILANSVDVETIQGVVSVSRELQSKDSPTSTRHVEIQLPKGFKYKSGDHLGVCPRNSPKRVERMGALLNAPLDGIFIVPESMNIRSVPKGVPLQVRNALTCLVDFTSAPTIPMIRALRDCAVESEDRAMLSDMVTALESGEKKSPLRQQLLGGGCDILALLERFPSCELNFFQFLEIVAPLRPRFYSTSSAPDIHGEGVAHVTVGRLIAPIAGETDRNFHGVSSTHVHSLNEGDRIDIFLDAAEGFHMQEDVTKPMILVSAGTGYAPMRAFLFERLALKRKGVPIGKGALFNGIRKSSQDYIYEDEIRMFQAEGVLDHVHMAMSRESPGKREYVQHKIAEQAALSWEFISNGGYVYICGSEQMRADVQDAFVKAIESHGGMSADDARAYMANMQETEQRYRPDVWG